MTGGKPTRKKMVRATRTVPSRREDRDRSGDVAAAPELEGDDAVDHGHQNDSEEGADVDELKDLAQVPGRGEREGDSEDEEDARAHGAVGLLELGVAVVL